MKLDEWIKYKKYNYEESKLLMFLGFITILVMCFLLSRFIFGAPEINLMDGLITLLLSIILMFISYIAESNEVPIDDKIRLSCIEEYEEYLKSFKKKENNINKIRGYNK